MVKKEYEELCIIIETFFFSIQLHMLVLKMLSLINFSLEIIHYVYLKNKMKC